MGGSPTRSHPSSAHATCTFVQSSARPQIQGRQLEDLLRTACPWPTFVSAFCIFSRETVLSPYPPTFLTPTIQHQHSPWLPEERCAAEGRARPGGALCEFCWGSLIPASSLAFPPPPGASPRSQGLQDIPARPAWHAPGRGSSHGGICPLCPRARANPSGSRGGKLTSFY